MNQRTDVSEINIVPVKPKDGLLGFCSFVINQKFYIGSVAIFSKKEGGIRLVYPKKNGIQCFHPIRRHVGEEITKAIVHKLQSLNLNEQVYGKSNRVTGSSSQISHTRLLNNTAER